MTTTGQNFELYQGDNKQLIITVRDEDDVIVNLTGYSAVWVAYNVSPQQVILTKTSDLGEITIPVPADGQLIVELEQADTVDVTPKLYGHQCEIEDSSGNHFTVLIGSMRLLKSFTHQSF